MRYTQWESLSKSEDSLDNVNVETLPKEFFTRLNSCKMPNFTAGVSLSNDVEYTASHSGYIHIRYQVGDSSATRNVVINGFTFTSYHTNHNEDNIWMPIKKGDVYKLVGTFISAEFFPSI